MSGSRAGHDVALVISTLEAGGAQKVATTLAHELTTRGYKVCVVTLVGPENDFFVLDPAVSRVVVDVRSPGSLWSRATANVVRIRRLRQALVRSGAGTVVSFMTSTNVSTLLAMLGTDRRVIVSERNDPARQPVGRAWSVLRRGVYQFAGVVSANSRGALDSMRGYVPDHKLRYVPNPVPPLPDAPGLAERERVALTVGRLTWQKGHDVLLRAFAVIADRAPQWELVVVGDGELGGELQALATSLGISDRVVWAGRVPDPSHWYRTSRVFALPSRFEGTPNVLLEAMAYGVPPIVTDASPGPLEFVEDGVSGLVVPVDDHRALGEALLRVMTDDELATTLGRRARERIATDDLDGVVEAWIDVLELDQHSLSVEHRFSGDA